MPSAIRIRVKSCLNLELGQGKPVGDMLEASMNWLVKDVTHLISVTQRLKAREVHLNTWLK
jgi:hypothetical protein